MNTKTTVIHHSADYDGLFCREISRKFLPEAELIGWDFKDPPLAIPPEGQIYILDLPVDRVFGFEFKKPETLLPLVPPTIPVDQWIKELNPRLVWIDHHKSTIESSPKELPGYRIDGVAACRLAWQWFAFDEPHDDYHMPGKQAFIDRIVKEPLAVRLAGEYDIWDKRDPRAEVFQFGLRSQELGESMWELLLSGPNAEADGKMGAAEITVDALLENGAMLQRYQQRNDAGMMHRSFLVDFEGLKFLALTTSRCNSLTFAAKDVPETGHDALMGFYFDGQKWNVSLYHAKHRMDLDLSLIAVKFGGGGHRGACGFASKKLPFA